MKKLLAFLLAASFLGLSSLSFAESPPVKKMTPEQIAVLARTMKPDEFKQLMEALKQVDGLPDGVDSTTGKPKPKPEVKPAPIDKTQYGLWLDKEGYVIPGPKIRNYIDQDRDGTDDRFQSRPGAPAGKPRPEKPGEKPGTGGPDPKPEKPGEGGEKPGGQLGGGERPKPPAPIRPTLPPKKPLPEELKAKMDSYKETQDVLRDELKAKINALGDDASREDVKNAAEAFKADNQERIDAQIAVAKEIHEGLKANRPKHDKGDRPEPPAAVKEKADAMKDLHQLLGKARHDLHEALKNASKEEREAMIAAFKEAQKDHHQQLKQAKKALREAIRDNAQTGDRRSED